MTHFIDTAVAAGPTGSMGPVHSLCIPRMADVVTEPAFPSGGTRTLEARVQAAQNHGDRLKREAYELAASGKGMRAAAQNMRHAAASLSDVIAGIDFDALIADARRMRDLF